MMPVVVTRRLDAVAGELLTTQYTGSYQGSKAHHCWRMVSVRARGGLRRDSPSMLHHQGESSARA